MGIREIGRDILFSFRVIPVEDERRDTYVRSIYVHLVLIRIRKIERRDLIDSGEYRYRRFISYHNDW
jgi:hypothetical protein